MNSTQWKVPFDSIVGVVLTLYSIIMLFLDHDNIFYF